MLAAAAGLAWWGTDTLRQTMTQQFSQTEGVVSDSYVTTTRRKRTTTYHAHVAYSYKVAGTHYNSQRFAFTHEGPEGDDKDWVEAHPAGTSVVVYYNPAAPNESTLRRGILWMDFVVPAVMFAALFLTGGILGWCSSKIRNARNAGGLPVLRVSGSCWAVSLTTETAWVTAGAVGAVVVMAGTILYGITEPASVGRLVAGQAGVVLVSMLVAVITFRALRHVRARRKKWLVVDEAQQTLLIPVGKSREAASLHKFANVVGFRVDKITTRSGSRSYIEYHVSLTGQDSGSALSVPVHAFNNQFEAESLASWLEERVGLRRAA
jgi:hypothetical protein